MTEHTYPEYLWLRKGAAPPPDPHEAAVRVYADTDGALRSVQSDGTDAALGGGGGGSQPSLTASITTDPVTFVGHHDFDLGGPASGLLAVTITAISADGETFGASGTGRPGFIVEDETGNGPGWSSDNVTFHMGQGGSALTGLMLDGGTMGYAVGQVFAALFSTPALLRVPITIFDDGGVVVYSGPHAPTVTVRADLVYLAP